eukprot:g2914.t1
MGGTENDRFNMIRRHSLRNEVDGSFEELEEVEDSSETPPSNREKYLLKHQECVLLNRVLSDKTKLPPACLAPPSARAVRRVCTRRKAKPVPQDESAIGGVVRRITGAVQPVLSRLNTPNPPKKELGGMVTEEQCRTLADYLSPSAGGQYLLPTACSKLLSMGDDTVRAKEDGNDNDYGRLKRRPTVIAKEGFPPTVC